jgi:hypothetical protein
LIATNEYVYWDSIKGWLTTDGPHQMGKYDVSKSSNHGFT